MPGRVLTVVSLLCTVCNSGSNGAAWFLPINTEITDYDKAVKYCDYNGVKVGIGSRFKDMTDCMACSCSKRGLGCASMAHYSVAVTSDSLCENVVVGCRNRWVLKEDPSKRCPRRGVHGGKIK